MLTSIEKILFAIAALISLYITTTNFGYMLKVILRGQGELSLDQLPRRLKTGLIVLINQGNIIRHRPISSLFHFFIAWGFLFYILVNFADGLEAYIPQFHFLGHTIIGNIYHLLADIMSVAIMASMLFFLIRRFITKDSALSYHPNITLYPKALAGISTDSLIVSGFILGHVGFHFLGASFLIASQGGDLWQPFANLVGNLWSGFSPTMLEIGWHISWWLALGFILIFLPYFPYSKHAHLFMGPFNFMLHSTSKTFGALKPLNLEDDSIEQFGVARLTDLPGGQIIDAFACIMCNRCQDACPPYLTGKELSPAALEINKRYYLRENMKGLASGEEDAQMLLEYAISQSALWACTACGACINVCPVGNEPMLDILGIRQGQVLMNGVFPTHLKNIFNGLETTGNPWQMTGDRLAWAKNLDFAVPTAQENPNFEILFWVGCAGAFNPDTQKVAQAIAILLNAAGVNFAVLGNQETCTGDAARRTGNEYLFSEMVQKNIEILNAFGVDKKRIVTGCPHCLYTLGKEYSDFGGNYVVIHHTQLISELIGAGRLKLKKDKSALVTFHDPCYLGRFSNEYDAPRHILAKTGTTLREMEHSKNNSLCCGAGGGQMWKEEEKGAQAVKAYRFTEIKATKADTLAVACPFCSTMLSDANKNAGNPMYVKDIAEIVVEAII